MLCDVNFQRGDIIQIDNMDLFGNVCSNDANGASIDIYNDENNPRGWIIIIDTLLVELLSILLRG